MQAEKPPPEVAEVRYFFFLGSISWERKPNGCNQHVSGSMNFLARQLGDLTRPSDVIAVASARKWKAAQDEGRQLRRKDWVDGGSSPVPASDRTEALVALVSPDSEPILAFDRIDTQEEEHVCGSPSLDAVNSLDDSQSAAAAPHFNSFDDDGNLQPHLP